MFSFPSRLYTAQRHDALSTAVNLTPNLPSLRNKHLWYPTGTVHPCDYPQMYLTKLVYSSLCTSLLYLYMDATQSCSWSCEKLLRSDLFSWHQYSNWWNGQKLSNILLMSRSKGSTNPDFVSSSRMDCLVSEHKNNLISITKPSSSHAKTAPELLWRCYEAALSFNRPASSSMYTKKK